MNMELKFMYYMLAIIWRSLDLRFFCWGNYIFFGCFTAVPTFDKTCGGVLYDQAGWLASPITDDGNYHNNENCWWFIVADLYQAITINITDIDIEDNIVCGYDFLRVNKLQT